MAKLHFRYGAMGSSKTANALMVAYNYKERGQKAILLKPSIDTRDGINIIRSRIGLQNECESLEDFLRRELYIALSGVSAIIVDEIQFATPEQIEKLAEIVDYIEIPVICYGLKTDFQGHLFEGSKRLIELADVIEEIKTVCWCGRAAKFNARICDGKVVKDGEQIALGANESYTSLCRLHYMNGQI